MLSRTLYIHAAFRTVSKFPLLIFFPALYLYISEETFMTLSSHLVQGLPLLLHPSPQTSVLMYSALFIHALHMSESLLNFSIHCILHIFPHMKSSLTSVLSHRDIVSSSLACSGLSLHRSLIGSFTSPQRFLDPSNSHCYTLFWNYIPLKQLAKNLKEVTTSRKLPFI